MELKRNITLKHKEMNAQALRQSQLHDIVCDSPFKEWLRIVKILSDAHKPFLLWIMEISRRRLKKRKEGWQRRSLLLRRLELLNQKSRRRQSSLFLRISFMIVVLYLFLHWSVHDLIPSMEEIHDFDLDLDLNDTTQSVQLSNRYERYQSIIDSQRSVCVLFSLRHG